jgi:hypothetical protein
MMAALSVGSTALGNDLQEHWREHEGMRVGFHNRELAANCRNPFCIDASQFKQPVEIDV